MATTGKKHEQSDGLTGLEEKTKVNSKHQATVCCKLPSQFTKLLEGLLVALI